MSDAIMVQVDGVEPEVARPAPEKVLSGDPVHRTWNVEAADGGLYAGVWESTPGEWRIAYDEWEFCQILSGHSVLCEDGGVERALGPGDAVVIRPGFRGTWRVLETTRKTYVIRV
ncbi:cupin domain-containing protein [Aureimonas flava]|uniref:Cupin domain-containing protein n=1 Tax=Aureimonas flava TaxID=2320271 RepID=A0A3A1WU47_9HYPH|nr:cupin domain-containing protein [Aureimonas flava]RIY01461.1 cupin domain-containing protein [Aureimonas flava]